MAHQRSLSMLRVVGHAHPTQKSGRHFEIHVLYWPKNQAEYGSGCIQLRVGKLVSEVTH
jgi:hypothetical protein